MSDRFIQLHLLTFYAPANLNRDDTGRPKTAVVGGVERLRISSQALKRAVRTSDEFQAQLDGSLALRTQRLGAKLKDQLIAEGLDEAAVVAAVREVAGLFGKIKPEKDDHPTFIEQLAFISPKEQETALDLARRRAQGEEIDLKQDSPLTRRGGAADIAMFGRMLADAPDFNCEAAVQVAHAFTTHRTDVEDDYYTAVDDMKTAVEDAGAGFIGTTGFGSGVFYIYVCINRELLIENLDGDEGLARDAIAAVTRGLATVSPTGKQASFASRARAAYILAERGDDQPRQLSGAFLKPVRGEDLMDASIAALDDYRERMRNAYGDAPDAPETAAIMNAASGKGALSDILAFVAR